MQLRFQSNYLGWLKLRAVAFSKKLPWFEPTKVITLKTQLHAVNAS